jgi:serine/threonine-protein kinase ATR
MQNTLLQPGLAESTLETWNTLATVLKPTDFIPYLALTSAIFAESWTSFDARAKIIAKRTLEYITGNSREFRSHLGSLAFFGDIEELKEVQDAVSALAPKLTLSQKLDLLCSRIVDSNASVSHLAIVEAKGIVSNHGEFSPLVSGDNFEPVVGSLVKALQVVAGREGDAFETSRRETFECLGMIGALDPDRFEIPKDEEDPLISFADFEDERNSQGFATHMIGHVLAPVFPKTSDVKFQSLLAYTIQELLSFCGFTVALITQDNGNPVSVKVMKRWRMLSDEVRATIAPLLNSKFAIEGKLVPPDSYPVYVSAPTYKEWIQNFASYLILQVKGKHASRVFTPFRVLLGSADVQVLLFLLPHLVLNVLSGAQALDIKNIRNEVISVLEDQVNPAPGHSTDMRLLCAQVLTTPKLVFI